MVWGTASVPLRVNRSSRQNTFAYEYILLFQEATFSNTGCRRQSELLLEANHKAAFLSDLRLMGFSRALGRGEGSDIGIVITDTNFSRNVSAAQLMDRIGHSSTRPHTCSSSGI
jgi:hypothetical protein